MKDNSIDVLVNVRSERRAFLEQWGPRATSDAVTRNVITSRTS